MKISPICHLDTENIKKKEERKKSYASIWGRA